MSDHVTSIKIAGLGGMGVLTATQVLAEVLFRQGWDVKKAEVHGMSQRGGSICGDVRYGKRVFSPMIPAGEIDYLVLFQEDQWPLYERDCSRKTVVVRASCVDASKLASKKALNIAMLGVLSGHLEVPADLWLEVIRETLPTRLHQANEAAFELGRRTARE